jgi:hypothetical protein
MDMIICSACGKQIPVDTARCNHCGRIQGFGHQNLGDGLIHHDPKEIPLPTQNQKTDGVESSVAETSDKKGESADTASVPEGKLKRLNSLITGKSAEPDLEALRREGVLPDNALVRGNALNVPGGNQESASAEKELPATGLPAWIRTVGVNSEELETSKVDNLDEVETAASLAELPDWVRKLQDKIQDRDDATKVDEPVVNQTEQKPSTDRLRKSGVQQRKPVPTLEFHEPDSNLIESVVAYLGGLKSSRKLPADRSRHISRSVWGAIGLAMFSLAAALLWSGSSVSALSRPPEADLAEMTSYIDSLSPESVVLIGMDYDVSLAGEIDNAALPVLVHLMRKQVGLVFISTRPTGPALSGHLIDLGLTWLPDYPDEKAFVFAFLPGEAAGLLQLAIDPRQALTVDVDGSNPWILPELTRIQDISDFSLVVFLTDSTGSGRDWLEQVQPRLSGVPLYAIVSKQAEPIYLPYRKAGQLQALMAGISEGADYERVYLFTTNNQQMLKAYHGVLLFIVILLACVILLSIFPQFPTVTPTRRTHKHASW